MGHFNRRFLCERSYIQLETCWMYAEDLQHLNPRLPKNQSNALICDFYWRLSHIYCILYMNIMWSTSKESEQEEWVVYVLHVVSTLFAENVIQWCMVNSKMAFFDNVSKWYSSVWLPLLACEWGSGFLRCTSPMSESERLLSSTSLFSLPHCKKLCAFRLCALRQYWECGVVHRLSSWWTPSPSPSLCGGHDT